MKLWWIALAATMPLAACGEPTTTSGSGGAPTAAVAETPPPPSHNWQYKEGLEYGYQGGLSDDDKKAGRAAAEVLMFRYLGEKDGTYTVAHVQDSGTMTGSCANPCQVVKIRIGSAYGSSTQRMAFSPDSIIGAVLTDAFNGQLEVYHRVTAKADE